MVLELTPGVWACALKAIAASVTPAATVFTNLMVFSVGGRPWSAAPPCVLLLCVQLAAGAAAPVGQVFHGLADHQFRARLEVLGAGVALVELAQPAVHAFAADPALYVELGAGVARRQFAQAVVQAFARHPVFANRVGTEDRYRCRYCRHHLELFHDFPLLR